MGYGTLFYRSVIDILGPRKKFETNKRLDNKVVVITGANTGIGKETALELSLLGAKIIIGCRNVEKAESAINEIKDKSPNAELSALKLDLASLKSVREFANYIKERESKIDILINNAGVMMCPEWKTEDGFEMQFGTNHLGHFLLTLSLLPLLRKATNARIIDVNANIHLVGKIHFNNINLERGAYTPFKGYAQSKLANVLFVRELAKRLGPKSNINVYSLHPGVINTELSRHIGTYMNKMFITPKMGAQTTLYCALDDSLDNESGHYYANCRKVDNMVRAATDDEAAKKLWTLSTELVKLEEEFQLSMDEERDWGD